jgi:endogenous inhibitor of DNA gyrase (YacG/DUF329 family)
MNDKEKIEQIKESKSRNDACIRVYGYSNSVSINKLKIFIQTNDINVSHWAKKKKYCPQCGLVVSKKDNRFCNSKCSATYNNLQRQPMSVEQKEKISNGMRNYFEQTKTKIITRPIIKRIYKDRRHTCLQCGNDLTLSQQRGYNLFCSNHCAAVYRMNDPKIKAKVIATIKQKIANGTHKGWQVRPQMSYPELFFKKVFEEQGLIDKCRINDPINKRDLGLNDYNNYFLDFHFFYHKLDLEIDGKQHQQPDRIIHDKERDSVLIANGYDVYRIKWRSINTENGKKYIENEINKFIEYYNNK